MSQDAIGLSHGLGVDVRDDLVSGYLVLPIVILLSIYKISANINLLTRDKR